MSRPLEGNPNLCIVLDVAARLGARVERIHRTGEVRVSHPSWGRSVVVNSRRKDTPRALLVPVRRLAAAA